MKFILGLLLVFLPSLLSAQLLVAFSEGTAEYRNEGTSAWKPLVEGQKIGENGYIRTGPSSSVELVKKDKVRLLISANSLAKLKLGSSSSGDKILMQTGKILADVFVPGAEFQVRTPAASMGVRGTQFTVLSNSAGEAQLAVKQGSVYNLALLGDDAQGLLVSAGQKLLSNGSDRPRAQKLSKLDSDYFDFGAFSDLEGGKVGPLYDHFAAEDDAFFQDFRARDLADYQLFVLDELDQQWDFFLKEHAEFARQLVTAPLKEKK